MNKKYYTIYYLPTDEYWHVFRETLTELNTKINDREFILDYVTNSRKDMNHYLCTHYIEYDTKFHM